MNEIYVKEIAAKLGELRVQLISSIKQLEEELLGHRARQKDFEGWDWLGYQAELHPCATHYLPVEPHRPYPINSGRWSPVHGPYHQYRKENK